MDNRPVKWINKFHEKRALNKANGLLSVSQFTADLTNLIFDLNKKFTIVPNLIDTSLYEINTEYNRKQKNILYFGSLIRKKGLLELSLIFNKVVENNPGIKLILVGKDVPDIISGNPSTWQMMQKLFSENAISNVTYLGSVPHVKIKQKIKDATICVFPSFAEAFPVSWLEAMAMEKPIVASNIGWASEVIDDEKNGFLVHPRNHDLFAEKITTLLQDESLCLKVGKLAREKLEKSFDVKVLVEQNIEFYESVKI